MPFEEIRTDAQQERRITHGQTVLIKDTRIDEGDWVKVVNGRQRVRGGRGGSRTYRRGRRAVVQPKIVFK